MANADTATSMTSGMYDDPRMLDTLQTLGYKDPFDSRDISGGKMCFVDASATQKTSATLQIAKFGDRYPTAPFGCSLPIKDKDADPATYMGQKITLDVNLHEPKLLAAMRALDAANMKHIVKSCKKWKGKALPQAVLETCYRPVVIEPKEGTDYAPSMRLRVLINQNDPSRNTVLTICDEITDDQGKMVLRVLKRNASWRDVPKHARLVPRIRPQSLYLIQNMFGMTINVVDAYVLPPIDGAGGGIVIPDDVIMVDAVAETEAATAAAAAETVQDPEPDTQTYGEQLYAGAYGAFGQPAAGDASMDM